MSPASVQRTQGSDLGFPMSDAEFARVAERISNMAGIVLEPHKRQMIITRLSRRLRDTGDNGFTPYLDRLDQGRDKAELEAFVNTLTTNLTSFFREAHHFAHLEREVLAPLKATGNPRMRIWSAGCSSGEEPYSIAMTVQAALGRIPPDIKILATDLDTAMVERGRLGVYPAERVSNIPARFAQVVPRPRGGDAVQMSEACRAAVSFRRLNLLEAWPMTGKFDAIFCRNVMIYFGAETRARLIDRFADALVPGGFLYLGHSEAILGRHPILEGRGETIYQHRGPKR